MKLNLKEMRERCERATVNTGEISYRLNQAQCIRQDLPACLDALEEAREILQSWVNSKNEFAQDSAYLKAESFLARFE